MLLFLLTEVKQKAIKAETLCAVCPLKVFGKVLELGFLPVLILQRIYIVYDMLWCISAEQIDTKGGLNMFLIMHTVRKTSEGFLMQPLL